VQTEMKEKKTVKSKKKFILFVLATSIAFILLLLFLIIPAFISSQKGRSLILTTLTSESTDRLNLIR